MRNVQGRILVGDNDSLSHNWICVPNKTQNQVEDAGTDQQSANHARTLHVREVTCFKAASNY